MEAILGTFLAVHSLELCASTTSRMGLISGQGLKILHATTSGQKKKREKKKLVFSNCCKIPGSPLILRSLGSHLRHVQVNVDTELWNLSAGHLTDRLWHCSCTCCSTKVFLSAPQCSVHLGPSQSQYCVVAVIFI